VTGIEQTPSGEWLVRTDKGDITCEHVVSATGNFDPAAGIASAPRATPATATHAASTTAAQLEEQLAHPMRHLA